MVPSWSAALSDESQHKLVAVDLVILEILYGEENRHAPLSFRNVSRRCDSKHSSAPAERSAGVTYFSAACALSRSASCFGSRA